MEISPTSNSRRRLRQFISFIGLEITPNRHGEKAISAVGGFIGILLVLWVSAYFVGLASAGCIVASMGASAVLLFAVPHGTLSQPWPVFGGHLISAIVGVACAKWIPNAVLSASVAVGLSVGVMYY